MIDTTQDWSVRTTRLIFWSAMALHVSIWVFAPVFFIPSYRIDTIEMMVIGQNWVLSSYKHPAMQGWIVECISQLTGHAEFAPYCASQLAVMGSIWGIWKFAGRCFSRRVALVAALAMFGYFSFNYDSVIYNNKTFFRMFWIFSGYFLLCAVEENRWWNWILCGLSIAAGLYCNLMTFLLVLTILAYMTLDPVARRYWRTRGPYLATGVAILFFLPLLIWTVANHFPQCTYAGESLSHNKDVFLARLYYPIRFLMAQILLWPTVLLPLLPLTGFHWRWNLRRFWSTPAERLVTTFILFPLVFELLVNVVMGGKLSTRMGCQLWVFFSIWVLMVVRYRDDFLACRRSCIASFGNIVFLFALSVVCVMLGPRFEQDSSRIHYPGKAVAHTVEQAWRAHTDAPLVTVRGDNWPAGCVSVYASSHPQVWGTLWSDEEAFRKTGGMLVWVEPTDERHGRAYSITNWCGTDCFYTSDTGRPEEWLQKFPKAQILESVEFPHATSIPIFPVRIGMAYVPPEP